MPPPKKKGRSTGPRPVRPATKSKAPSRPPAAPVAARSGPPPAAVALTRGGPEGPGGTASADFAEFLTNVGKAMVRAQQDLDAESQKYSATEVGQALPAMFRVPRVGAQMKFALDKLDEKKIGLVFFGRDSQVSESYQHTLDFEVVAVPPPPGSPAAAPPGLGQVLSPAVRDAVLNPLLESPGTAARLGLKVAELEQRRKHLLLWRLADAPTPLFQLGHALPDGTRATLQLVFSEADAPSLKALWGPEDPPAGSGTAKLARWLADTGAEQAALLG